MSNLQGFISPMSLQACNSRVSLSLFQNPLLYKASRVLNASAPAFQHPCLTLASLLTVVGCLMTLKSYVVSLCSLEAHSEGAGLAAIACPVLLEGCSVKLSIQEGWPYLSPPPVPRLTCIAPMFSISCSALEAPRSTELTPSFLRHQAVGSKTRGEGDTLCRACLATPGHRHSSSHLGSRDA